MRMFQNISSDVYISVLFKLQLQVQVEMFPNCKNTMKYEEIAPTAAEIAV